MKYVVYTRVSTQAQGVSHLGLDAQVQDCTQYVAKRRGIILKIYEEIMSGSHKSKRHIVLDAIEHARKESAVLLVARLDRLGRSQAFLTSVRQSGISIESVEHGAMSTMLFGIFAAISEHERELISTRTKAGLAEAKKNGVQLGRRTFGDSYIKANDARHDTAVKRKAPVLEILRDSRADGDSYKCIVSKLDRYNMRTASGSQYTESMLRRMLCEYNKSLPFELVVEHEGNSAGEERTEHGDENQERE